MYGSKDDRRNMDIAGKRMENLRMKLLISNIA